MPTLWSAGQASRFGGRRLAKTSRARGQVAREQGGRVEDASSRVVWWWFLRTGAESQEKDVESVGKAGPSSLRPSRQRATSSPGQGCAEADLGKLLGRLGGF